MRQHAMIQQALETVQKRGPSPSWLEVNPSHASGKMRSWPTRDEISYQIDEQLIVELYSK
jgi:small subunit ribosomal protein S4